MYIDTHTQDSMQKSICDLFHIYAVDLQNDLLFITANSNNEKEWIEKLNDYITEKCNIYPDEILLFHLTRRLHGAEDAVEGRNLADLLLSANPLNLFMNQHDIGFEKNEQHIDVIYKGIRIDWDRRFNGNGKYMKSRLGYIRRGGDFGFNGFAIKDLLFQSIYAKYLSRGPEFIRELATCLDCESVAIDYIKNSEYYCFEYKLPLSVVMFDDHAKYSYGEKQRYLIRCILQRLYKYQMCELTINDYDELILRLADDYIIPAQYYIGKEKITDKMLNSKL